MVSLTFSLHADVYLFLLTRTVAKHDDSQSWETFLASFTLMKQFADIRAVIA